MCWEPYAPLPNHGPHTLTRLSLTTLHQKENHVVLYCIHVRHGVRSTTTKVVIAVIIVKSIINIRNSNLTLPAILIKVGNIMQ